MATTHFILQGKGGVGKSLVASALIQSLTLHGVAVQGIDTDPVNATLGSYKEFSAKVFNIMDEDNINSRKFDEVLEIVMNAGPEEHIVIDNGASSFIPLMSYLKENDAVSLIQENGHDVFLHTVITGGQAMQDTMKGLKSLCVHFPSTPIVVWLNLYFGDIVHDDKSFDEFAVYKDHKKQFHAVITIPNKNKGTFGKDVEELLAKKMSFEAGINSSLPIMVRQRLKTYWREFEDAISQAHLAA